MKGKRIIFMPIAFIALTLFWGTIFSVYTVNAQSLVTVQDAFDGIGNGSNGKFIASVEAPVEGSRAISSAAELRKIGAEGGYSLDGDYHLTADIDLAGSDWEPIGTESNRFTGTFDGQGHVIRNLKIAGEYKCAGLFGYVGGMYYNGQSGPYYHTPHFINLGLEDIDIDVTGGSGATSIEVGGLFGNNHRGDVTVNNCYITGSIKAESKNVYAGGFAGITSGYNPCGKMALTDSYNDADVYAKTVTYEGFLEGFIIEAGSASIGGLVGCGTDVYRVTNCHNFGNITSDSTGASSAGGLLGFGFVYEVDKVIFCSNRGDIKAISEDESSNTGQLTNYAYAGGIIGYDSPNDRMTTITGCYNEGTVLAHLKTTNTDVEVFAGGIGGRLNNQAISDCYNKGAIDAHNVDNTNGYAAGISGRVSSKSNVRRSYNTGTISGVKKGAVIGYSIKGSTIRSNYYQSGTAAQGVAKGDGEEGTTARTLAQMKLENSYNGFDFSKTWGFKSGENNDMPVLQQCYPGLEYTPTGDVPGAGYDFSAEIESPKEGSYPIGSVEELLKIGKEDGLPLTWDYHLTTNLDLTGISWEPIDGFRGVFDGQGYAIHNLEIIGDYENAGLFGEISSDYYNTHRPVLKNIALENVYINIVGKSYSTSCAGGVLGNNDRAYVSIQNCYVTGEINNTASSAQTGGIVGRNGSFYSDMFNITDCQNYASITSNGNGSAGGILGVGGYVENMDNCSNYGRIGTTSKAEYCVAGGVIGNLYNGNTINNCFNIGDIGASSTLSSAYINAGGIIGFTNTASEGVFLTNSYNIGDISATLDTTSSSTSGELYAGGISGRSIGINISDCFNTGNVSAIHNWNTVGSTGGITGVLRDGSVRRSYSTGNVTASENVGGIVGTIYGYGFTNNTYWNSDADFIKNNVELETDEKKGVDSGEDATTAKTEAQLKQEATFKGLNFKEIWGFQEETDYPVLRTLNPDLSYVSTVNANTPQKDFIVKDFDLPKEGSIPIATREDLENIRNDLTGTYHLVADIDLTGIDWDPIGDNHTYSSASRFSGTFDGQGHVITGLEVIGIEKVVNYAYTGLFGYVGETADIRNLGLEDVYITNSSWTPRAGGIIAYAPSCKDIAIDNCYTTGDIISTNGGNVGGVAGYISGSSSYVTNCYNLANLTSSSGTSIVGGIVGYLGYGKISGSYNKGEVSISPTQSDSAVGGIAGSINNTSEIVNSYNKGKITMNSSLEGYAGGIAGCIYESTCKVSASYNMGDVFASTTSTTASAKVEAGGIAGKSVGSISDSFNTSKITASSASTSSTDVNAGGIVGKSYSDSSLSKCYSTGGITSRTNVGGIAGFADANATVSESYWNNQDTFTVGSTNLPQSTKKGIGSGTDTTVGLTTSEMKNQTKFEGFDFEDVWSIADKENDGFPMIQPKECLFTVTVLSTYGGSSYNKSIIAGEWAKGKEATITAPDAISLYRFKEWEATGIELKDSKSADTTFTMIGKNASVTAVYEKIPSYTMELKNCITNAGASRREGEEVTVYANTITGKTFKEWSSDDENVQFADKTSGTTTFIMPGNDVTIEAVYDDIIYNISVTGGIASSDTAIAGETITIRANEPEEGKSFYRWERSSDVTCADAKSAETTFVMPAKDVTLEATYQDIVKESQTTPQAPTLAGKTKTSITLNWIEGAQYRCNSGAWQDSPVFSGLSSNTYYSFYVRMKETATHNASYSSASLYIQTDAENTNPSDNTSPVNTESPKDGNDDGLSEPKVTPSKRKKALTPVISKQPKSKKLKKKAKYTVSVTAKVGSGTLSYQWQKSTKKNKGFKNIAGAASKKRTYKVPTKKKGTIYYRCIITNTDKNAITTKSKKISKTVTIKVR